MTTHHHGLRPRLRYLYASGAPDAKRFRYGLLALDLVSILWIIAASFLPLGPFVFAVEVALGAVLLAEYVARLLAASHPWRMAVRPLELFDLLAILSLLLAPFLHGALGFLRVLRTLRLLNSARLLMSLRDDLPTFRRNEAAVVAATQLAVFIFVMTGVVFQTQHRINPQIGNYGDALYFTVTALTTTGFGDIVPKDTFGRLITVVIMLAGVTLFLRLAQALFRPAKVDFTCPTCALSKHEPDAVHCKACGVILKIPDQGED